MRFIGRFMVEFGLLSSVFDVLTFAVLLGVFQATVDVADECDERINCLTLSDDRGDEPSSVRRPPLGHR